MEFTKDKENNYTKKIAKKLIIFFLLFAIIFDMISNYILNNFSNMTWLIFNTILSFVSYVASWKISTLITFKHCKITKYRCQLVMRILVFFMIILNAIHCFYFLYYTQEQLETINEYENSKNSDISNNPNISKISKDIQELYYNLKETQGVLIEYLKSQLKYNIANFITMTILRFITLHIEKIFLSKYFVDDDKKYIQIQTE